MRKPFLLWTQCQISTDDGCQYKKREMLQGFGTQLYLQGHIYSQLEMPHDSVRNDYHIRPCGHTSNACRYFLLKSLCYDKTQTLEQVETLRVILNGLPHRVTNRSENQETSGMLKKNTAFQTGWLGTGDSDSAWLQKRLTWKAQSGPETLCAIVVVALFMWELWYSQTNVQNLCQAFCNWGWTLHK